MKSLGSDRGEHANLGPRMLLARALALLYMGLFPLRTVTALRLPENWGELLRFTNARGPSPAPSLAPSLHTVSLDPHGAGRLLFTPSL